MSKLIFLRHGVRQLNLVPPTPEPGTFDCILKLASDQNLNLAGHLHSYKVGKFIKKEFKENPDIIYADITDSRTIDTSIALSLGLENDIIYHSTQNPDLFFNPETIATKESLEKSERLLIKYNDQIQKIKKEMEKLTPCLHLANDTPINPKNNAPLGLVNQEYTISTIALFAEVSEIKDPLLKERDLISSIQRINWLINHPGKKYIKEQAETLFGGIGLFLKNYKFSIMIGHHHDINFMTQFLDKPFKVPDFPEYWVPPNSGLIFTQECDKVVIDILYLDIHNKFKIIKYMEIKNLPIKGKFELIPKRVNY